MLDVEDLHGRESRGECAGILLPMEVTVDSVGRVVVPKALREALGLRAGSKVDITR